jgi:ribose 5-phosphate isomerase B
MTDEERIRDMVRRVVHRTLGIQRRSTSYRASVLVTERQVHDAPQGGDLVVPKGALVTPLARQAAMERRVSLVEADLGSSCPTTSPVLAVGSAAMGNTVALGADHGGYALKEELKAHVQDLGYQVVDCGTDSTEPVDYPDFALAVAQLVAKGHAWRGIIVDGAGIGSCMAANKVPGVRAALCYDQATAVNSRGHNHANVLTLGAGMIGANLARQIVSTWLETPSGGDRHARRVDKIMDIERRYSREE